VEPPRVRWEGSVDAATFLEDDLRKLRVGQPLVRAGLFRDASVSVGTGFVLPDHLKRAAELGHLPILVRSSGGSALLHLPGDLVWSIVLPRYDPRVGTGFVRAYPQLGRLLVRALQGSGLEAVWKASPGLSERFCLFGPRGDALFVGDRVLGGAAQHATVEGLLHHGVVGATVDRGALHDLFEVDPEALEHRLTAVAELDSSASLERVGLDLLEAARGWTGPGSV
jgi:lipoate-protein ligase A